MTRCCRKCKQTLGFNGRQTAGGGPPAAAHRGWFSPPHPWLALEPFFWSAYKLCNWRAGGGRANWVFCGLLLYLVCPGVVNSAVGPGGLPLEPLCVLPSVPWQPQVSLVLGWYQPVAVQGEDVGIAPQSYSLGTSWTRLSRVSLFPWARSPD